MAVRIVDVTDVEAFQLLPPCADPGFDHRTCDYWEDADRGSAGHRQHGVVGHRQLIGGQHVVEPERQRLQMHEPGTKDQRLATGRAESCRQAGVDRQFVLKVADRARHGCSSLVQ